MNNRPENNMTKIKNKMTKIKNRITGAAMCEGRSLEEVLGLHAKYLNSEEGACLTGCDIRDAIFTRVYMADDNIAKAISTPFKHAIFTHPDKRDDTQ